MRKLLSLLIVITILAIGCTSKSGRRHPRTDVEKPTAVSYIPSYTLQVMRDDGYVENIRDSKNIRPKVGDTLIIEDFGIINSHDSSVYTNKVIWGFYRGKILASYNTDSSWSDYYRAIVIKN